MSRATRYNNSGGVSGLGTAATKNVGTTTGTVAAADDSRFTEVRAIAEGGTNQSAAPAAGGSIYGTGTALATSAAGLAGQHLVSGGAGAPTWAYGVSTSHLSADVSNSTTTPAKLTTMDKATGVGTFVFKYMIDYQSSITTTGIIFDVNYTGTVSSFVFNQMYVSSSYSSDVPSQSDTTTAYGVMGARSSRAISTAGHGVTPSVGTANADMLMVIEGLMVVTVAGNLELWHGSETAAATTVKAGTSLILTQTA